MSLLSGISNFLDKDVKIRPWLQFVGYMLAFGGLVFTAAKCGLGFGVVLTFVALGISMAGFDYKQIYP